MKTTWDTRQIAEHSYIPDLLPECPVVLDVGCRDFGFTKEILKVRPKAQIVALDPDPEVSDPKIQRVMLLNLALVGDGRRFSKYASFGSNGTTKGYGNFLADTEIEHQETKMLMVRCINVQDLMHQLRVFHWDLVKLDCEGSEYSILENWPGRIATQLSVEFHDFMSPQKHDKAYFDKLFGGLTEYKVVQHEAFDNAVGYGHWDTVLVLKGGLL